MQAEFLPRKSNFVKFVTVPKDRHFINSWVYLTCVGLICFTFADCIILVAYHKSRQRERILTKRMRRQDSNKIRVNDKKYSKTEKYMSRVHSYSKACHTLLAVLFCQIFCLISSQHSRYIFKNLLFDVLFLLLSSGPAKSRSQTGLTLSSLVATRSLALMMRTGTSSEQVDSRMK